MKSTLLSKDITVLLKDISGIARPEDMTTREESIKNGAKAYDMIPFEKNPSNEEMLFYEKALEISAKDTATAVEYMAETIFKKKGKDVVLVSLARGGIAAGILCKRYLDKKYCLKIPHYALTLIGTMGIDENALEFILKNHSLDKIQFIDGWTGKGAISRALTKALHKYKDISSELAVLADPANITGLCGTNEDILIASSCLNAPLAGLISRAVPYKDSFFGAVFFENLIEYDRTYHFIDNIEKNFTYSNYKKEKNTKDRNGLIEVENIASKFGISDIHFIKPGICETMRALIRKKPDIILVKEAKNKYINFIVEVASKNKIALIEYPLEKYNTCSIYKDSNSDIL